MMDHLVNWIWSLSALEGVTLTGETLGMISNDLSNLLEETTLSGYLSEEEYEALEDAIRDAGWDKALLLARKGRDAYLN